MHYAKWISMNYGESRRTPTTGLYSELMSGKRRVKPLEDAAFEQFKGSCVVRIIHAFSGKIKGISICTDEIMNYDSNKL